MEFLRILQYYYAALAKIYTNFQSVKQLIQDNHIWNLSGIFIVKQTDCWHYWSKYGLCRMRYRTKRLHFIFDPLEFRLIEDILARRILHFAYIHDIIRTINQQIDLCTFSVNLISLMLP